MGNSHPKYQWRIDTNDRYQKAVGTIIGLTTASLVLPTVFLRDILGIPKEEPLFEHLNWLVYISWFLFGFSIISGIIFYYASAKWVKQSWGEDVKWLNGSKIKEKTLERILDWLFRMMMVFFVFGIVFFVIFALFASAKS
jgi:hypothetical protein